VIFQKPVSVITLILLKDIFLGVDLSNELKNSQIKSFLQITIPCKSPKLMMNIQAAEKGFVQFPGNPDV
jgi:hypothetical protein